MLYTMLRSNGKKEVADWVNKNEKSLKPFYATGSALAQIKSYTYKKIDGELTKLEVHYDDGDLVSVGNFDTEGKQEGYWEYYCARL